MAVSLFNFVTYCYQRFWEKTFWHNEAKGSDPSSILAANIVTRIISDFDKDRAAPSLGSRATVELIETSLVDKIPQEISHDLSLEELYADLAFQDFDVHAKINFSDYLSPNETRPIDVKQHLDHISKPGLIVSVGFLRSLFDLILCDPEKCHGLVVVDINPRVKACVDFVAMLLRITEDRAEFANLSGPIPGSEVQHLLEKCSSCVSFSESNLKDRMETIRAKLEKSDIPEEVKKYYLRNLENLAEIYFSADQSWKKESSFEGVKFFEDDRLFNVLQSYAKSGKIIALVGDINDLQFLSGQDVAIVDISNVTDYGIIDLKGGENFHPRVIWTKMQEKENLLQSQYFSYTHRPFPRAHKAEMDLSLGKLKELYPVFAHLEKSKQDHARLFGDISSNEIYSRFINQYFVQILNNVLLNRKGQQGEESVFENVVNASYSEEVLAGLKEFFQNTRPSKP